MRERKTQRRLLCALAILFAFLNLSVLFWNSEFISGWSFDDGSLLRTEFFDAMSVGEEVKELKVGNLNANVEGMNACLLVKDDNHFLVEWLAYHYHVLPLKNLIIAVDPSSRTSPEPILKRWRKRIRIETWESYDDYGISIRDLAKATRTVRQNYEKFNITKAVVDHRVRQRLFYQQCLRRFFHQGRRHWTLFTDTDEFLMINYDTINAFDQHARPIDKPGSVLAWLNLQKKRKAQNNVTDSVCLQIPRLRFGAQESVRNGSVSLLQEELTNSPFNESSFLTLRWRGHAHPSDIETNKISKSIVDLGRLPRWGVRGKIPSIHRPVRAFCGIEGQFTLPSQIPLIIHHYLGTYEQFSYRDDPRAKRERSSTTYDEIAAISDGTDDDIRPWLSGFIATEGRDVAEKLLAGVGEVDGYW